MKLSSVLFRGVSIHVIIKVFLSHLQCIKRKFHLTGGTFGAPSGVFKRVSAFNNWIFVNTGISA